MAPHMCVGVIMAPHTVCGIYWYVVRYVDMCWVASSGWFYSKFSFPFCVCWWGPRFWVLRVCRRHVGVSGLVLLLLCRRVGFGAVHYGDSEARRRVWWCSTVVVIRLATKWDSCHPCFKTDSLLTFPKCIQRLFAYFNMPALHLILNEHILSCILREGNLFGVTFVLLLLINISVTSFRWW